MTASPPLPPPPAPPPGPAGPPPPPPPSPPGPPPTRAARRRRPLPVRILRAALVGALTGLAAAVALAYAFTASLGPPPAEPAVCREIPADLLTAPYYFDVSIATACSEIDADLGLPLGGVDGFEALMKAPDPPGASDTPQPAYLVWESDGCSAPVLGSGPFDFSLACARHDFGWRNLKAVDRAGAPVWHVGNKDRVDAGFLWDMRTRCASLSPILRIGCDTTARVYYTAVRLNPSGVEGLPGRE